MLNRLVNCTYGSNRTFGLAQLGLEAFLKRSNSPILVYTMGKVGSSTIYSSLKQTCETTAIYHFHTLDSERIEKEEETYSKNFSRLKTIHTHLLNSIFINAQMAKGRHIKATNKWKVVSLVRDPIKRNISSFFQTLNLHSRDLGFEQRIKAGGDLDLVDDMIKCFIDKFSHTYSLNWFNTEIYRNFKIDVMNQTFNAERGYEIYEGDYCDLLVLRLDQIDKCAEEALEEFLNLEGVVLENHQIAEQKYYNRFYKEFNGRIKLPKELIDTYYNSPFSRVFFSESELEEKKSLWSNSST